MTSPAPVQDDKPLFSLCEESVAALERALPLTSGGLTKQVDVAERAVVRLRDILIERVRQDNSSVQQRRWRTALTRVNAALSLIVGVEYPAAAIQKSLLEQALDTLKALQATADEGGP